MSHHTPIELLSDDDGAAAAATTTAYETPNLNLKNNNKRTRLNFQLPDSGDLLIIDDDDVTPPKLRKSSPSYSPPLVIPETPLSELPKPRSFFTSSFPPLPGDVELIDVESQSTTVNDLVERTCSEYLGTHASLHGGKDLEPMFSVEEKRQSDNGTLSTGFDTERYLDIDSDCYLHKKVVSNLHNKNCKDKKGMSDAVDLECSEESPKSNRSSSYFINLRKVKEKKAEVSVVSSNDIQDIVALTFLPGHLQPMKTHHSSYVEGDANQDGDIDKAKTGSESGPKANGKERQNKEQLAANKKKAMEDKLRLIEEKKRKKEQDKIQKAASKIEDAKLRKLEKEKQKLEKFKFSEKNIMMMMDTKVVQLGKIGGHLLTAIGGKDLKYEITSNPIEKSIVWRMTVPVELSQVSSLRTEVSYILLVYEAEEFCKIVNDGSLFTHISSVQALYPGYKICYLTNRDNDKFNNRKNASDWVRPAVEKVFAKIAIQFANVHTRQCADEAELAEHIVGLTSNLAKCYSRKKLTRLSVNANGSNVPKGCSDRHLIKSDPWLKALVSIPKVQPRFAIAIKKKYKNMRSLLTVYLDPNKSVHEKEFLLKDLLVEGADGEENTRLGEVCSKRVYRILMARDGSIETGDVENGADSFHAATVPALA